MISQSTSTPTHKLIVASVIAALLSISIPFATHAAGDAKTTKHVDATCMQTAVDAREDAIATSFTTFTTSLTSGLSARKMALHDAWGMSDAAARKVAVKKAWTDWKTAKKAVHTKLKSDRKASWETFKTAAKTCKVEIPKEEGLEKDSAGSLSL